MEMSALARDTRKALWLSASTHVSKLGSKVKTYLHKSNHKAEDIDV